MKVERSIVIFLRKLEVTCGMATAVLGIAAAAQLLHINIETMRRLERNVSMFQELLGASILCSSGLACCSWLIYSRLQIARMGTSHAFDEFIAAYNHVRAFVSQSSLP